MTVIGKSEQWPEFMPECDICHQPKDALVMMLPMSEEMGHHIYEIFVCKDCLEIALYELNNPELVQGPD